MAIIRQNSVSGIVSVTAQSNALDFYDNTGNKLAIGADVTGNLTGTASNATGITTTQITVGDTFLKATNQVGLGTTSTAGRDAGIGTATGTIIYNSSTQELQFYNGTSWTPSSQPQSLEATGGTISVYTSGDVTYRVHTFNGSNTFEVTNAPPLNNTINYLIVAGGGGGGGGFPSYAGGGGGGAGGYRTGNITISAGSYTIQVGGGGDGATGPNAGNRGTPSFINNPGISSVTSTGGGGGKHWTSTGYENAPGGSGGGGANNAGNVNTGPGGSGNTPATSPPQGNDGGDGSPYTNTASSYAGGGGGSSQAGNPGPTTPNPSKGGDGTTSSISGSPVTYAGGGGGGGGNAAGTGGSGGGGTGGTGTGSGTAGTDNLGGGGGGAGSSPPGSSNTTGGNGGSGVVIISYPT